MITTRNIYLFLSILGISQFPPILSAPVNETVKVTSTTTTTTTTAAPVPVHPPIFPVLNKTVSGNVTKSRFSDPFCPTPETMQPCTCSSTKKPSIKCRGFKVNQKSIEKVMETLRKFNGVRPDQWLSLKNFTVTNTLMTQLDLSPFNLTRLETLSISNNLYLIEIIGAESNVTTTLVNKKRRRTKAKKNSRGKIDVKEVDLSYNALSDEGLKDTLKYFASKKIERLNLAGNGIQGSQIKPKDDDDEAEGEFLPDLSRFKNLRYLNLSWNAIEKVSGAPFRLNNKLGVLALENNRIDSIGANAFTFEDASTEDVSDEDFEKFGNVLAIHLNFNQLSNDKISAESGLESIERTAHVFLEGNKFEFISSKTFIGLLTKDETSLVDLSSNPLNCDNKLKWIKKQKGVVRRRVKNAVCANDGNETIFTSKLV